MTNRIAILLLGLIIVSAFFVRTFQLNSIPPQLHQDEFATLIDATSLLATGTDADGNPWPLLLNHYNQDLVEWMYTYGSIPFVWLFGPNALGIRMLAAIAGTLTILFVYPLARELFDRNVGLLSALFVALSPWHLHFSRLGFRGILAPLFTVAGIYIFLKALKQPKLLPLVGIIFGLSLHTYSVMKVFMPLLLIILLLAYRDELKKIWLKHKMLLLAGVILFILLALPMYITFFQGRDIHFQQISIFAPGLNAVSEFIIHYLRHLSPNFLFTSGDQNLWHSVPGIGQVLIILLPFVLIAFFAEHKHQAKVLLLSALFAAALVPASLTDQGIPHALRTIIAVPWLEMIAALGLTLLWRMVLPLYRKRLLVILIAAFSLNISYYLYVYFVRYPLVLY